MQAVLGWTSFSLAFLRTATTDAGSMRLKEDVGGVSLSKNHVNEQLYTLFRQPLNAVNPKRCSSAFIEELCTYRKREKVMTSLACSLASCFIAVKGKNGGEQHRKAKSGALEYCNVHS